MITFLRKLLTYSTWRLPTVISPVVVDSVINCSHRLSQTKPTARPAANLSTLQAVNSRFSGNLQLYPNQIAFGAENRTHGVENDSFQEI